MFAFPKYLPQAEILSSNLGRLWHHGIVQREMGRYMLRSTMKEVFPKDVFKEMFKKLTVFKKG